MNTYNREELEEEFNAQKEELSAAMDYLEEQNRILEKQLATVNKRNSELDELVYRMYHDLKSPISTSLGLLSIIEDIPEQDFTHHMKTHLLKMEDIMNSMTDYAKSLLPPNSIHEVNVKDFKQVVEDISNLYKTDFKKYKIDINYNHKNNCSIPVSYDHLFIIVKQLIKNSITFRNKQKDLKLEITIEKLGKNIVRLNLRDNGIGMETDVLENATKMYYRGSSRSMGSGLGLYIVNNLIEHYSGKIHFKNIDTEGLLVTIDIPTNPFNLVEKDEIIAA